MKTLLTTLALIALTGCASVQKAAEKGAEAGAEANDSALRMAVFTICRGASVGSIRRYFNDPEKSQIWQSLCSEVDAFELRDGQQ